MKKFILFFISVLLLFPGKSFNAQTSVKELDGMVYSRNSVAVNEDTKVLYHSPASNIAVWWQDMYVDGNYSYCLKFEDLIENTSSHELKDPLSVYSQEVWNKFTLYAMYGERRYAQTKDVRYRYATQALIHGHFLPQGSSMRFYSFHSGVKQEFDVNSYKSEIVSLYESHIKLPLLDLDNTEFKVGDSYSFEDKNNILRNYSVENKSESFEVSIDNNNLVVEVDDVGEDTFKLKSDVYSKKGDVFFWTSNIYQDLITVTSFTPSEVEYTIASTPKYGSLELYKIDSETKEPLHGAKFVLRKLQDKSFVDIDTIEVEGFYKYDNLELGTYQLEEIVAPIGYDLSELTYEFEIVEDMQVVILEVENNEVVVEVVETLPKTGLNYSYFIGFSTLIIILFVIRKKAIKNEF